jgi:ubiquinone/menaquinone biosynthesis C-methylase UbiE
VDSGHGTAVDVGCGSGQSTYPLRQHFNKVIGIDVSEKQIEHAKKKYSDVEFKVGPGENLQFLENCSVNLITTATIFLSLFHNPAKVFEYNWKIKVKKTIPLIKIPLL